MWVLDVLLTGTRTIMTSHKMDVMLVSYAPSGAYKDNLKYRGMKCL